MDISLLCLLAFLTGEKLYILISVCQSSSRSLSQEAQCSGAGRDDTPHQTCCCSATNFPIQHTLSVGRHLCQGIFLTDYHPFEVRLVVWLNICRGSFWNSCVSSSPSYLCCQCGTALIGYEGLWYTIGIKRSCELLTQWHKEKQVC